MKAVIVREFGAIETLELGELPTPRPGPGEVLVGIRATAVNFVDLLVIAGKYQFLPPRPFSPGKLPTGVVEAVGEGVTTFALGDRVLAMAEHGGYAAFVAVPEDQCVKLPDAMPFVDAASMALAFDTAWFALRERACVRAGETVLVLGATGAVGLAAVQLAKAFGAKVIASVSRMDKAEIVRAAGADEVVDLSRPGLRDSLRDQVYALTDGRGADVILDPLGDDIFDAALRALAWSGRLVVIGFAAGRIPTIKANYLLLKNIEVSGLQISDYRKRMPQRMAECFTEIFALYVEGRVRPPPTEALPLERYAEALTAIAERKARGRIVLTQDG